MLLDGKYPQKILFELPVESLIESLIETVHLHVLIIEIFLSAH